eukprot:CAMPEP_0196654954 /NCGR_PEP_ID=MMETSP1086-20130531/4700_1 /TAXON_ID=77921 /ORGANISM="Cyanoptyche  gloeocystis , Strain SAG4.97" /LENGTH=175 /DNA_ID=CAMNT_0041987009 /DNA_START=65 /DNA_END=592 /DNA_ORIENTATION=-
MTIHQFQVVGRGIPTEKNPNPKLYRMKLFAPNQVVAKSRFWYFLSQIHKLKKTSGQILACHEINEEHPDIVKNYGVWIKYNSRTGTHNMYKEYRDTTINGAVEKMYADMASRHRARFSSIQIVKAEIVPASAVKRPYTLQFINHKIKFPIPHRVQRVSSKSLRSTFVASRPSTFS